MVEYPGYKCPGYEGRVNIQEYKCPGYEGVNVRGTRVSISRYDFMYIAVKLTTYTGN